MIEELLISSGSLVKVRDSIQSESFHRAGMYRILGWLSILIIVALAALGFAQKADPKDLRQHSELLSRVVSWLQRQVWILVPTLSAALLVLNQTRKIIGPPWVKKAIHNILTTFGEVVFAGVENPESAYDRVTLFKRKSFHPSFRRWPWSGWMVPVNRSGHTSQRLKTLFRAPDNPSLAEGMAGFCWAHRKQEEIEGLPKLTSSSPDGDLELYAKKAHISIAWVRDNLPQARSYFAFAVVAKGKPWGAVVLDSRAERIIGTRVRSLTTVIGGVLSELVERS